MPEPTNESKKKTVFMRGVDRETYMLFKVEVLGRGITMAALFEELVKNALKKK